MWQQAAAQGWLRYMDATNTFWLAQVEATANGGAATLSVSGYDTLILRSWDSDGLVHWRRSWNLATQIHSSQVHVSTDQSLTVISANRSPNTVTPFCVRLDAAGNTVFQKTLDELTGSNIQSVPRPAGGFFVLSGKLDSIVLYRYDAQMVLEMRSPFAFQQQNSTTEIIALAATNSSLCFSWRNVGTSITTGLSSLSHSGALNWTLDFAASGGTALAVKPAPVNGYFVLTHDNSIPTLRRIGENGQEIWQKSYPFPTAGSSFTTTSDGGAIMVANDYDTKKTWYTRYNSVGNTVWQMANDYLVGDEWSQWMVEATDGSIFEMSRSYFVTLPNPFVARLLKFSGEGGFHLATAHGQIFDDTDNDCNYDTGEKTLEGWVVSAKKTGQNYTTYTTTDSAGQYGLTLDTGSYLLQFTLPNNYWQSDCEPLAQSIVLANPGDSLAIDLPLVKGEDCPLMEVDLGTPFLRRCFENTYNLRFVNNGTLDAPNAWIDVALDPNLDFISASLPSTALPANVRRFQLGAVPYGGGGAFQMLVVVNCDSTVLGQTHCTEAHIYPDTVCLPNTGWSGAEVEVDGNCAPDSVRFTIKNVGTATTALLDYIIIQDDLILRTGSYSLPANDSIKVAVPANGSTYRLQSEQEPNAPGNAQPSATIEGCGTNALGGINLGFVTQFGENDGDPFISIDCTQNRGSFDPNDKQGFPVGVGTEHHILPGQEIEYLIRFQNTGTDTAFRVVIRDTLSEWLDPASVRVGVASHPMQFQLLENGILKFDFRNILLPDSNINEAASHGFVKFRVAQAAVVPLGTVIYNQAGIYFDFNAPVITNQTWHTVDTGFLAVLPTISTQQPNTLIISRLWVYPMPARGSVQAVWFPTSDTPDAAAFQLFDLTGRLIEQGKMQQNTCVIQQNAKPSGVYFLEVRDGNGKRLRVEKLVFE